MNEIARKVIKKYYGATAKNIESLGGGFYGKVFLVSIDVEPFKIVVKIYLEDGLAIRESEQLKILGKHALLKMPQVYHVHMKDMEIDYDILMMTYLSGVNAGVQENVNEDFLDEISESIVDNLIAIHSIKNPNGFGEIGTSVYWDDWRDYYQPKVENIYESAIQLHTNGELDDKTYHIIKKAYEKFDQIFYLPITDARLIHGDYNTWNVMLNESLTQAVAVIDPFGCCWGDSEYDLYQLNNANGKYYQLLDRYKRKCVLSENFELKICFYELFTELMHFHDAGVEISHSDIPNTALKMEKLMNEYNI